MEATKATRHRRRYTAEEKKQCIRCTVAGTPDTLKRVLAASVRTQIMETCGFTEQVVNARDLMDSRANVHN